MGTLPEHLLSTQKLWRIKVSSKRPDWPLGVHRCGGVTHSAGGRPLHRDRTPSCRVIFTNASCDTKQTKTGLKHDRLVLQGGAERLVFGLTTVPLRCLWVLYQQLKLARFSQS